MVQEPDAPFYPPDAFAGTAQDYARYRVPYPSQLLADLTRRAGVSGAGRLIDLACGPGRIALAVAGSFSEVWAIDLEPEMIAAGQAQAERRGITNIRWMIGRAEDLEAPAGAFELITVGEAFHRLDRRRVAEAASGWLIPGGGFASLGGVGLIDGAEPWQGVVREVARRWTALEANAARAVSRSAPPMGVEYEQQALRDAGFVDVANHVFIQAHEWTLETILGYLHSTSFASRRALGDRAEAFEAELTAALLAHDPGGRYREDLRFGYIFGRRPGPA